MIITEKNKIIPFVKPYWTGNENNLLKEVIESGKTSGDGIFTKKCTSLLKETIFAPDILLTTSCTHALELAAMLINIRQGDEVIMPSYTFVSTINAFVLRGATPRFLDIRPDTLNIDETKIENAISKHTKAIVPVHYAGVGCEMDTILKIAENYKLEVIEDNAHGLFGKYKNKYLGTMGSFGTQSFHDTKNLSCGEGGALIINDLGYLERAEILREKGTERSKFYRGEIDKYTWVDIGSSYLPSEITAAVLFAQLERWESIQKKRKYIWDYYFDNLARWSNDNNITLPTVPDHCDQAYHMFYLLMPTEKIRNNFIKYLKINNISAVFHYLPLHTSVMGERYGYKKGDFPITEEVSFKIVRLPFYNDLTKQHLERIISTIKLFNQF